MSRPEDQLYDIPRPPITHRQEQHEQLWLTDFESSPPDLYYDDNASRAYTTSSRIQHIQSEMTHRALELLNLTSPSLILDVGCGSGLSGEILSETDPSHTWIGMDISPSMLAVARMERDVEGDLFLADMGQGVPFRPGTFDAAISISAVQWLCNAETAEENEAPDRRLKRFFGGLYVSLRRGGRAVLQFYPKDKNQRDMICKAAINAGFGAGLLEDDGGTKNAKTYLVCTVGGGDVTGVVAGMEGVDVEDSRRGAAKVKKGDASHLKGSKAWITRKKDQMEKKGKVVKASSKYTGRKRKIKW